MRRVLTKGRIGGSSTHIDILLEVVAADVEVRQSVGHQFVERERVRQLVDAFARQAAMRHIQVDQTLCRFRQRRTQVTGSCYKERKSPVV